MFETFDSLNNFQKLLVTLILAVILYGTSASISYAVFSNFGALSGKSFNAAYIPTASSNIKENPSEPKTESCPLNGSLHTKTARSIWEKRRPLAVMIENHLEARPQSGLTSADVVYEAVAEGGITRFMAVFYCNIEDIQVGPVRSARTYFLDWASEYDPLYAHVGGANTPGPADALGQIVKYHIRSLNQFGVGFPTYWRDYQRLGHPVATEHTMYSTTNKLWEVGEKRGWGGWNFNFTKWKFKDDQGGGQTNSVIVNFWGNQPSYGVEWVYDPAADTYKRKNGGLPHIDLDNNQQIAAHNVVVQFEDESNANDGYENNVHLLYDTIDTGDALILQDGKTIKGKWVKDSRVARTKYLDSKGVEIKFNKGLIWIQTVPVGAKVSY